MTTVTFVMPVRNEARYIRAALQSLAEQTCPSLRCEIIVVDGQSSDGTAEIVNELRARFPQIRYVNNPAGIVPTGMNIGIRAARGQIIIRADGHTIYPPDYAENCVKYLELTGADNVGGPCVTVPADESFGATLVAAIRSSSFGVGNSKFRTRSEEGFVDTVPFGAFRRELFDRVGFYNEKLVRNQDNDLNARIRNAGGRIYLTPALATHYYPDRQYSELLRYAFRTSRWHIFTLRENKKSMGGRHLAPAAFLASLLFGLAASFVSVTALAVLLVSLSAYLAVGYCVCLSSNRTNHWMLTLVQPFATLGFHVAYGAGTLFGFIYLFKEPSFRPIRSGLPIQQ